MGTDRRYGNGGGEDVEFVRQLLLFSKLNGKVLFNDFS